MARQGLSVQLSLHCTIVWGSGVHDSGVLCLLPVRLQAVLNMRACLEHCYSELQQQLEEICCGWQDFLWAVQVGSNRHFSERGAAAATVGTAAVVQAVKLGKDYPQQQQ